MGGAQAVGVIVIADGELMLFLQHAPQRVRMPGIVHAVERGGGHGQLGFITLVAGHGVNGARQKHRFLIFRECQGGQNDRQKQQRDAHYRLPHARHPPFPGIIAQFVTGFKVFVIDLK